MAQAIVVIHLYPSLTVSADGAAAVVRSLVREQLRLRLDVYFGCNQIDSVDQLNQMRLTWSDVMRSAYFWGKSGIKSRFGIKDYHSPKVIHVHGLWDPKVLLLSLFLRNKGDVCVHSTHGMMSSFSFNYKRLKKICFHYLFQSPIIKKYEIHVANSEYELSDLSLNFPSSALIAIPNGVDQVPQSFHLSSQRSNILYFGRLHPKKNVHVLVAGFGLAQRAVPNLALHIVGEGDPKYTSDLQEFIIKNGIQNVTFAPAVDYERRFYVFQNALVTALPSENENFGIVVAESLACGVPVIVSANMPWDDVVTRGCGWIVDTTPESISDTLVKISQKSKDELSVMGRVGAEWIRNEFAWQNINHQTVKVYCDLLGNAAGGDVLPDVSSEHKP